VSIRVLVVDDEAPARRRIQAHLANKPDIEIVGHAANGREAVDAIKRLQPDLVFLDIQMPGLNGFEVIEAIGVDAMPAVVFVTAYDEHALDAFDVHAVDYLMKPFAEDRFERALQRAVARIEARAPDRATLTQLLEHVRTARPHLQRIVVRDDERLLLVSVGDVIRFTAEGNYVALHTAERAHLVRETITHLEAQLDPAHFARIHRSEIVNIDWIREVHPLFHGDHAVILKNGEERRLSRRFQDRLLHNFPRR
jgi:two-component system, LytTR family, response regulator